MYDPVYRTMFFVTNSGQSKCMCEASTACREGANMMYLSGDGRMSEILPDNAAVFKVHIYVYIL